MAESCATERRAPQVEETVRKGARWKEWGCAWRQERAQISGAEDRWGKVGNGMGTSAISNVELIEMAIGKLE